MRYKKQGQNGTYRMRVPMFEGGLNADAHASVIEDNELGDVCNLRIRNGVLQIRPTLIGHANQSHTELGVLRSTALTRRNTIDQITRQPFDVDGELCIATIAVQSYSNGPAYQTESRILIVTLDGEVKASYTMPDADPQAKNGMVLIPVDAEKYKVPFLVYHYGRVFRPNGDILEEVPDNDEHMYVPLVMINGKGGSTEPNGVMFEGFNLLTDYYRAQFTTDTGTSSMHESFAMPTALQSGSAVTVEVVTNDGVYKATATVNGDAVPFTKPDGELDNNHMVSANDDGVVSMRPPFDKSPISNNVTVTAKASGKSGQLKSPTCGAWFGGTNNRLGGTRVFLAGFSEGQRAKIVWSDVNDPFYFPENNYTYVGDQSQAITALDKQEDMLVIFKERETYYTTYVEGDIDESAVAEGTNVDVTAVQAYFPVKQLSPYVGCDCPNTVVPCRNRLVWMNSDGRVYTLASANQYSERNIREIGQKIRPRLLRDTTEATRRAAYAADYDGEYIVLCGNQAYAFCYGAAGFVNVNSYASSSNAAKRLAWFVYRFDGLTNSNTAIVSDGADRALVIRTGQGYDAIMQQLYTQVRYIHTLGDGVEDTLAIDNGETITTKTSPIVSRLRTKTYTLGNTAFCRLKGLWMTAQAEGLHLCVEVDGRETALPITVDSEDLRTHFVPLPIKRCHRLALALETDRPLTLSDMEWHYSPFGYVK